MICEEFERKRFLGPLQERMNRILYKFSRRYKNPAVFQFDKNGEDLSITMSGIWGNGTSQHFVNFMGIMQILEIIITNMICLF